MSGNVVLGLLYLAGAFLIYFLPAIIADRRNHSSAGGVIVLNLLLGWTVLGWVIALIWACSGEPRKPEVARAAAEPTKRCAFCAESILRDARVCKHCNRDLPAPAVAAPGQVLCDCGTANPATYFRCKNCGTSLTS